MKGFNHYAQRLRKAFVLLDGDERAALILKKARALAGKKGLALVEDDALLAEMRGLIEWPVVLMGAFDADFLDVPQSADHLDESSSEMLLAAALAKPLP